MKMKAESTTKTGMYSPWVVFVNQIKALFANDPDVDVEYHSDEQTINLYVADSDKADALMKIMPMSKKFGNITVYVRVIPANDNNGEYLAKCFETAFYGNDAFSHLTTVKDAFMSNPLSYCVFKKEVVQYPNDNIFDEHGVCSTLYQDLAHDIFGDVHGVFFCTDTE